MRNVDQKMRKCQIDSRQLAVEIKMAVNVNVRKNYL